MRRLSKVVVVAVALLARGAFADPLTSGFGQAQQMIHDFHPSSGTEHTDVRSGGGGSDDRTQSSTREPPQPSAFERWWNQHQEERRRRAEEKAREEKRIADNLQSLTTSLANAAATPAPSPPSGDTTTRDSSVAAQRQRDLSSMLERARGQAASTIAPKAALGEARAIHDAVAQHRTPPFKSLWNYYLYNRDVALGLAPDQNRCAIRMSMTLGLKPRPGEASLQTLADKDALGSIVSQIKSAKGPVAAPEVTNSEIASRYYLRAHDLADRLKKEWGEPMLVNGPAARQAIAGKKGVVFLEHAYQRFGSLGRRTGDHIDVWDSDHVASTSSTPFEKAEKVWFWEIGQ